MKWFLVVSFFLLGSALADDFKFDPSRPLVDLQGKPLMDNGLPMTVGAVAGTCVAKEQGKGPGYWALAQKLVSPNPVALTTAEIKAVMDCVAKLPPIISGQVDPAVDPNYTSEPIK